MHSSTTNPLVPGAGHPWLPPISFGVRPYLELCQTFDQALAELEARFPSRRPLLTLEARTKRFKRKKRRPK